MVGFENYLAQMIIKTRQCVMCKNHVATSKVKFTVGTYSLCIGLNETYSYLIHNFVVGPAPGMVRYNDLVFHLFIRSHQGAFLLEALCGGISVLWTYFFSVFFCCLFLPILRGGSRNFRGVLGLAVSLFQSLCEKAWTGETQHTAKFLFVDIAFILTIFPLYYRYSMAYRSYSNLVEIY